MKRYSLNTMVTFWLFLIMTTFIFVFNFSINSILGMPAYLLTNIIIIVFIGWTILQCLKNSGSIKINRVYKRVLVFILLTGFSVLYSYNRWDTIDKLETMIMMFVISICIFQFVRKRENLRLALIAYSWSGFLMALYLLSQSSSLSSRLNSVMGDTNLAAITLAFSATVAIHLLKTEKCEKKIYILHITAMSIAILLLASRTAFAILVASIIFNVYISAYQNKWKLRYVILASALIVLLVICVFHAIMNVPVLYNSIGMRVQSFFEIANGKQSNYGENSTQIRQIYAMRAFKWFMQSPLFGHGLGTFHSYNITFNIYGKNCFSHCGYTEILSSLGILGFVAFYMHFFRYVRRVFSHSKDNEVRQYNILMGSLALEFLIAEIGLVMYYAKVTWILFALLAGMYKLSLENRIKSK